jgi:pimeloyl-ACP methyl ester carboxylesterase
MTRALAILLGAVLLAVAPVVARAVEPGQRHAYLPKELGLTAEPVSFAAADSTPLDGWWFAASPGAPVLVLASRGSGTMADLLPVVFGFQARGFAVLTFDYRDFGPGGRGAQDSLRFVVFASRWVDDMQAALRYARVRGGGHVFAWGQDLGSAVALAAAARHRTVCDAVVVEGLFRNTQLVLRANGTSVIPGVPERQRELVDVRDEPSPAAQRLMVPLLAVIAGKDQVTPPEVTRVVVGHTLSRVDRWELPEAGHQGIESTPGYYDRVGKWLKRWTVFPPGR